MTFDRANKKIVIFGGRYGKYAHGDMNDLWEYHLPTQTWYEISGVTKNKDPVPVMTMKNVLQATAAIGAMKKLGTLTNSNSNTS